MSPYLLLLTLLAIHITNSCVIDAQCDPRCKNMRCSVFYSQYDCCDGCVPYVINYYQERDLDVATWTSSLSTRCTDTCPPYQYPYISGGIYTCEICDRNCLTCTGPSNTQCLTCDSTAYQLNATSCYNMPVKAYGYNPCPDAYYGIELTMRCEACPTGCTTCNINL